MAARTVNAREVIAAVPGRRLRAGPTRLRGQGGGQPGEQDVQAAFWSVNAGAGAVPVEHDARRGEQHDSGGNTQERASTDPYYGAGHDHPG
jgi:hypothetical protein